MIRSPVVAVEGGEVELVEEDEEECQIFFYQEKSKKIWLLVFLNVRRVF